MFDDRRSLPGRRPSGSRGALTSTREIGWARVAGRGAIVAFVIADLVYLSWAPNLAFAFDAASYWRPDLTHLYDLAGQGLYGPGAFRYAPVVALVLAPLGVLAWPAFVGLWTTLLIAATVALAGRRWWMALLVPATLFELWAGNIHLLIAAAIVFGFRYPALWAFMALTKVTPFIGVLWFAFRGEWRRFAIALGTTLTIVAVGSVTMPALWVEWFSSLAGSSTLPPASWSGPLIPRLVAAVLILAWAARRDRKWALPIVVTLALPNIWLHGLAVLVACVPLSRPAPAHPQAEDRTVTNDLRARAPSEHWA